MEREPPPPPTTTMAITTNILLKNDHTLLDLTGDLIVKFQGRDNIVTALQDIQNNYPMVQQLRLFNLTMDPCDDEDDNDTFDQEQDDDDKEPCGAHSTTSISATTTTTTIHWCHALESLIASRWWDRIVVAYCRSGPSKRKRRLEFSSQFSYGIVRTKQLEIYGSSPSIVNLFPFLGEALQRASAKNKNIVLSTNSINKISYSLRTNKGQIQVHSNDKDDTDDDATNGTTISHLKIRTCLNQETIQSISDGIARSKTLQSLQFTSEFQDCETVLSLGRALRTNQHLTSLSFYGCELFDEKSTGYLLESLHHHPTLQSLELCDNNCFVVGSIVDLIRTTKTLQTLQLYHPAPSSSPADADPWMIVPPPHGIITTTTTTTAPASSALSSISNNNSATSTNRLSADTCTFATTTESIATALLSNRSLRCLILASNGLQDASASCLAMALRVNKTLEVIDLQNNFISDPGMIAIGTSLPEMKGLKHLYLWNNPCTAKGTKALLQGLYSNVVLEKLTIYPNHEASKELMHYVQWNKAGRRLLSLDDIYVPISLWPLILGRVTAQEKQQQQHLDPELRRQQYRPSSTTMKNPSQQQQQQQQWTRQETSSVLFRFLTNGEFLFRR